MVCLIFLYPYHLADLLSQRHVKWNLRSGRPFRRLEAERPSALYLGDRFTVPAASEVMYDDSDERCWEAGDEDLRRTRVMSSISRVFARVCIRAIQSVLLV